MTSIVLKDYTLKFPGKVLLDNTNLTIMEKCRCGLVGRNGSGKSTLLKDIVEKFRDTVDMYYLEQEIPNSSKTVYNYVLQSNSKRNELIERQQYLESILESEPNNFEEYQQVSKELNGYNDEPVVRKILGGLGFLQEEQDQPVNNFSGGWKMRISLARGLYLEPKVLLLDEPTNHLDLEAIFWLKSYLSAEWKNTLVIISHDQYFLNAVCNNIACIYKQGLLHYKGDYNFYEKAHLTHLSIEKTQWEKIQRRAKELRKKSTPKPIVNSFLDEHIHLEPPKPYLVSFNLHSHSLLKPPMFQLENVTFGYNKNNLLLDNITMDITMDTRATIVGRNGCGKSTLLKLLIGELQPISGHVIINDSLRIGYYSQHTSDAMPSDITPVEYLHSLYPKLSKQDLRKELGTIGLDGKLHIAKMSALSGGQQVRVALASIICNRPHILILDEPTNHMDIETISGLINAINNYDGGIITVTHNGFLIEETGCDVYHLDNGKLCKTTLAEYEYYVLDDDL